MGFVDWEKTPIRLAPDIAPEVLSPSEHTSESLRKVWIYRSAKSISALEIGESLTTPLLPGWELALRDLFER
jgi:hypothetical protein